MKFSRATTLIALCAVSCLLVLPSVANAQVHVTVPKPTTDPATKSTTEPTPSTQTTSKETTQPTTGATTTTAATVPTTTTRTVAPTTAPVKPSTTSSVPTLPPPIPPPVPTGTGGVIGAACANSDACGGLLCALTPASPTAGTCQAMPSSVCRANPPTTCSKNSDCNAAYSYCMSDNQSMTMICVGLGTPGQADYCGTNNNDSGSLAPTIKYAGIAVGCVAALGLLFAGVRWQRRRQRSKVPENMFGEIDYGMTDRSAPKSAEQTYPFSSRPHAHGSDHAPSPPHDNGYDNQYYDDGYQKDQYYGNDQYNSNNQYYGNQQDNYGYDHHSGHGGQGGQGGQGGGFYDNVDYNDYPQNGSHHSPIATPAAAVRSPRQNNYGAEPSELDYGGHGGNGGYGQGGHGGHGGHGGQGGYY